MVGDKITKSCNTIIKSFKFYNEMKNVISIFLIFSLLACDENEGNGSLLVTVEHESHPVEQATIYLKAGIDTTSLFTNTLASTYKIIRADAIGQAYFDNLLPNTYTIYGVGYSVNKKNRVEGETTFTVLNYAGLNHYKVVITAK